LDFFQQKMRDKIVDPDELNPLLTTVDDHS
jgi:hypothetical protein